MEASYMQEIIYHGRDRILSPNVVPAIAVLDDCGV